MLTRLKNQVQLLLVAEAKLFHRVGMTPNRISTVAILSAFLAGCFYWLSMEISIFLVVAPTLFLLSGFLDAIDGVVARLYGESTVFGGFLDSLLDRYSDAFIFVALIASGFCDVFWGTAALVGSLLVSYTRARAEASGITMETVGIAERAERILIISISSLLVFLWPWSDALNWATIVLAVLTNLTVLQRSVYFFRKQGEK